MHMYFGLLLGVFAWPAVFCASLTGGPMTSPDADHVNSDVADRCKCVPDQWQGILVSTDREYDLRGGQTSSTDNRLSVHYDYRNKKFAMTDLITGSRAIADYKRGYKYVIRGDICHGLQTKESMKQMCLPEGAEFLGAYTLGTTVPVDMWEFHGPFNTSMRTAVLHDDCVPVSEEIYMHRGEYVSVTSSMYLDVKLGSLNDDVFTPPGNCVMQHYGPRGGPHKRSNPDAYDDLLNALRRRLYIFN